jgi:hypothetical protein
MDDFLKEACRRVILPTPADLQPISTMPRMPEEAREQCRLVGALRKAWHALPDYCRPKVFAVPNGGKRNAAEATNLKAQGVLAGVTDLIIMLPLGKTIWLEMKADEGRMSPTQKLFSENAQALGHHINAAYSAEQALAEIRLMLMQAGFEVVTK